MFCINQALNFKDQTCQWSNKGEYTHFGQVVQMYHVRRSLTTET